MVSSGSQPRHPEPFVARDRELAAARERLGDVFERQGCVLLVIGEAGIGKTRFAHQAAREAELRGAAVVWGRCYEGEGAPAFWPWIQVLRGILTFDDPDLLRVEVGASGAHLAHILPELEGSLPDLPGLPVMSPEQARFRLFDAVTNLIKRSAGEQALMIVLEDLHWADQPSLLLLEFLVREMQDSPLLVLGSYRNVEVHRHHPLSSTLAALTREPIVQRITLHRFTVDEVGRLIQQVSGTPHPASTTLAVWEETEGNPFFVTEVVRLFEDEAWPESPAGSSWEIRIPESIRDVVGQRLDRLSDACNEVLAVAAVAGREFNLPILEVVTGVPGVALLPLLDEASQAQIIEPGDAFGHYRFSHRLIQETLYDELPTARRFQLHSQLGAALEGLHAADLREHYGTIAHHYAQAPLADNIDKAIAFATKAADRAMEQTAWEQAIAYYELALQVLELLPDPTPAYRCDLLLALGSAQDEAGRGRGNVSGAMLATDAHATYWAAVDAARAAQSPAQLARAAVGIARSIIGTPFTDQRVVSLLEEALMLLPAEDSIERALMQSQLAAAFRNFKQYSGVRFEAGSEARIEELSIAGLAMADRVGDPFALAVGRWARLVTLDMNRFDEVQALVDEILRLEHIPQFEVFYGRAGALGALFVIEMWRGNVARGKQLIDEVTAHLQDTPTPRSVWSVNSLRAGMALSEGRYAEVEPIIAEMDAYWPNTGAACNLTFALCREQDRLWDIEPRLNPILQTFPGSPWFRLCRILYLVETGDTGTARQLYGEIDVLDLAGLARGVLWAHVLAMGAELSVLLEDRARARACYELLAPYPDHVIYEGYIYVCAGSVSHYLGLLATLQEEWAQAEAHFGRALKSHQAMGFQPLIAHTRHTWARMLLKRGAAGDQARARELLDQAGEAAHRLGMLRLQRSVAEARDQLDSLRAAYPYDLSRREVEVLRLVVEGLTDVEIAERLYLSPRTVSTYLSSIYNKLGVNSRAAAAAITVRAGLA